MKPARSANEREENDIWSIPLFLPSCFFHLELKLWELKCRSSLLSSKIFKKKLIFYHDITVQHLSYHFPPLLFSIKFSTEIKKYRWRSQMDSLAANQAFLSLFLSIVPHHAIFNLQQSLLTDYYRPGKRKDKSSTFVSKIVSDKANSLEMSLWRSFEKYIRLGLVFLFAFSSTLSTRKEEQVTLSQANSTSLQTTPAG